MDRIYISATAQHAGKTTTSLGLYQAFERLGKTVSYIKPVGQRFQTFQGVDVDEDAVLFKQNLKCRTPIEAMTAVTIPRGFTEKYIFDRNKATIYDDIDKAVMRLNETVDITIIEGTGHAGVGSVFDASNAVVACLLGSKAVIISGGGIGNCLDQIALNQALFQQENVQVIGAIINKILPEKYDKIKRVVTQGLKNMDLDCLGMIPYQPELTFPTIHQVQHSCKLDLISGDGQQLLNHVCHYLVAALPPEKLAGSLKADTMLIIPGGCQGAMLLNTLEKLEANQQLSNVSGLLFTDGQAPEDELLEQLKPLQCPLLFTTSDAFTTIAKLGNLIFKISPDDNSKVDCACQLMEQYLDIDKILAHLE